LAVFLPLVSAILFVFAALMLKRASDLGADVWRTTRVTNYITAAVAIPLWLLGGTVPEPGLWWEPPVAALFFFAGQVFTLLALNKGDVSVATPVLGIKIVLVALLTAVLIGEPLGAQLWTAATLSSGAIALLNVGPSHAHRRVGLTILLAAGGAIAYATFDVLVQKFSATWGTGRFLPIAMTCGAIYSAPLQLFESKNRQPPGAPQARWLAAGSTLLAVQGMMFIVAVSFYRQVTSANVLYSSRGLWSVVGVWAVGHWFANRERHLGARVLVWRFIGALMLMAAILMVLLNYGT
jgi:drug/metabolite transporter (DMT)-like permease